VTPTCVLLDHDDTLLPTFGLRSHALTCAARDTLGRDIDAHAVLEAANGRSLEQMSRDLAGGDGDTAARLVAAYRHHYAARRDHGLAPYPGILEMLAGLRAAGVRMAVVTSKLGDNARRELAVCGLDVFMDIVVAAEDVEYHKPHAEPLLRAMTHIGAQPRQTLMVGDTGADIGGARSAGVLAGAALWGTRNRDTLLAMDPDYRFETPAELLSLASGA